MEINDNKNSYNIINCNEFEVIENGTITSVPNVLTSSCHCGIRKFKDDISVILIPGNTTCSGVFTKNKFAAAPVVITQQQLAKSRNINAIVVNSGIANACTGEIGLENAKKTIEIAAKYLNLKPENIIVSSTGRIGKQLPLDKIDKGIYFCSKNLSSENGHRTAKAILTIDKHPKEFALKFNLSGEEIFIGGIAKGSVMIEPNMATTLAFIATNIKIEYFLLDQILKEAVEYTFNSITTDGCQSTNDMVIVIANNQSVLEVKKDNLKIFEYFKSGLVKCLESLSKKVVEDAEGATKFIEINVLGAKSFYQARQVGKKVANSILFKTAMYGEDVNWGRIAAAVGSYEENDLNVNNIDIFLEDIPLMKNGVVADFNEDKANEVLKKRNICFTINLNIGSSYSKILTSDISYEYIKINALYKKQK